MGANMAAMEFQEALLKLHQCTNADVGDISVLSEAEAVILDHEPRATAEAVVMIDVLIDNVSIGCRSDERDIVALKRLRTWLTQGERRVA